MTRTSSADSTAEGGSNPDQGVGHLLASGDLRDPEPEWLATTDQDPVEVALAHIQWRLVQAVMAVMGRRCGSRLAVKLGVPARAVQYKLTGEKRIQVEDLAAWSLVAGLDLGDVLRGCDADLLPEPWRPLARHWEEPPRSRPTFRESHETHWPFVSDAIVAALAEEQRAGRGHLLDEGFLRHATVQGLDEAGIALEHVTKAFTADIDLLVRARHRTAIRCIYWPDSPESVWDAQEVVLYESLSALRDRSDAQGVVILAIGSRAMRQLDYWQPALADSSPATAIIVSETDLQRRALVHGSPGDYHLELAERRAFGDAHLVVLLVK